MSDDDKKLFIEQVKTELVLTMKAMQPEIKKAVAQQVDESVNGKINALRTAFDTHVNVATDRWEETERFMKIMTPAADGIQLLSTLRKFAVWIGGFGIVGTVIWLGIKAFLKGV